MIRATPRVAAFRDVVRPYQRVLATASSSVVSNFVPQRLDATLTSWVTRVFLAAFPQRRTFVADRMSLQLDDVDRDALLDAADRYWLHRVETRWGGARGTTRRGWRPRVEFVGGDHITAAKAEGRGVIVWRVSSHSAIPLNVALSEHGFGPVHLSRQGHLLRSSSDQLWPRLQSRAAAYVRRGEERWLAERVEMAPAKTSRAMKRLMAVLGENGVVTIVGDLPTGRKSHRVRVNSADLDFANGGARLAVKTGAALLPVTVERTGPMRYRVDVGAALIAPVGVPADAAVENLIEQFAHNLAAWIRRDPAQWPKWRPTLS